MYGAHRASIWDGKETPVTCFPIYCLPTVFILARLISFLCSLMLNLLGMRLEVRSCYGSFNYLDSDGTDCRIRLKLNCLLKRTRNSN